MKLLTAIYVMFGPWIFALVSAGLYQACNLSALSDVERGGYIMASLGIFLVIMGRSAKKMRLEQRRRVANV